MKWADSLRGQTMVYPIPIAPAMPAPTNPSTYNVSAWSRKMDGHPKGHLAVLGDLRVAAATLSTVENMFYHLKIKSFQFLKKLGEVINLRETQKYYM